ncbi:MAG: TldD/PmbA family protein, partial [Planctomycetota bacterium]
MPEPAHPLPMDQDLAQRVLQVALENGGDEAEVFAEYSRSRSIAYEEGKVRSCNAAIASGMAVRVVRGEAQGLAFVETGREEDLLAAARSAARIAVGGTPGEPQPFVTVQVPNGRYQAEQEIAAVEAPERIALAAQLHDAAASADAAVSWIQAQLLDGERWIQVANSDGTWATDYQPMLRVALNVYLQAEGRRERGYTTFGQRAGYEVLSDAQLDALAAEAVRLGRLRLEADPCPAGSMPVVLAAGSSGVLIHEAVGHGLEADFNRRGVSAYSKRLGEQVASPLVTII